jgi:sRNA-binding carbon storage regulator CsrA
VVFTVLEVKDGEAEVMVQAPNNVAVSGPGVGMVTHVEEQYRAEERPNDARLRLTFKMAQNDTVLIGRGVTVVLAGFEGANNARIAIEAPRHIAVSRDDFKLDEHLAFQARRDAARG